MKKITSIIISSLLVVLFVSVSGASVPAFANPSEVTPTEEVTPSPEVTCTPTPTEEVTPTPTQEVTPTPTEKATPTPTEGPKATPTPEVLSVKTMAKTGTLEQSLMNLSGIFGMLSLMAGSLIYAKKQKIS